LKGTTKLSGDETLRKTGKIQRGVLNERAGEGEGGGEKGKTLADEAKKGLRNNEGVDKKGTIESCLQSQQKEFRGGRRTGSKKKGRKAWGSQKGCITKKRYEEYDGIVAVRHTTEPD